MLKDIDVMVYDIQDVGVRCYTFISTLGLVMRACGKAGIEVLVLDRPNPLGGNKVEGPLVEEGYYSFVSQFHIPFVYGLTVGELAALINEEGLNKGQKGDQEHIRCKLNVVAMRGWHRWMQFRDTGLPWILPSPNIPSMESALCYASSGICGEYGHIHVGVGYTIPFQTFAIDWIDADALKARLDSYNLPGVAFRTIHYKPIAGYYNGKLVHGVQFFSHAGYRLWYGLCKSQFWKAPEGGRYCSLLEQGRGCFQGPFPQLLFIRLTFKTETL